MVRGATREECERYGIPAPDGLDTWVIVLDEGGIKGHLAVTFGNGVAFGHDTRCWSDSPWDALKLWLRARREVRARGLKKVRVHVVDGEPTKAMWLRLGFEQLYESSECGGYRVLEGDI